MEKLKVLLLNQNPMIKKLVTMACGKLNLDVENVARIPADFRARDYVCIIVDDENVGKNLEKLTTLQDKIKVCLLFSRKTQVKHHEFNIAIQKPFLPTEILEVLNACIPSEEELAKRAQKDKSIEAADKTKEINMDLKSAEVNMPDILGKDAKPDIHINKEALESEAKDTKDLEDFDFDPDTLDLDALEKASGGEDIESTHKDSTPKETGGMVLTTKDEPHEDSKDSGLDSISDFDNLDFSGIDGVSSEDSKDSTKDKEQDSKGAFDKDLSDLKDSKDSKKSDNPLDLANFDLDSMIDASALKSASSGLKKEELEKQAREAAENHSDDDLFLDEDDELAKLRPKPKDFLKAKESEAKAGGADSIKDSIKDSGADSAKDSTQDSIKDSGLDSISDFDNLDFSGIDGVSEDFSKDSKDTKDSKTKQKKTENIESNTPNTTQKNATNTASNIDSNTLDSINEIDNLDLSDLGGDLSSDLSGDLSQNVASNFLDTLDETSKTPEITALAPNENALNADISSDIDLASTLQNLDSKDSIKDLGVSNTANKDSTNAASERATNESLDNAFADLSAALENAFGNLDEDDGTHNMDFHDFVAKQNMQDSALDSTLDTKQDSIKDSIKDSGTSANLKDMQSNFLENIEIPSEDSTKNERATNESLDNAFADLSAALENAFGNLDEDDGTHNMDFHDFVAKQNMQDSSLDSTLDTKQDSIKDSSLDSMQDLGVSNTATLDSINDSTLDSNLDSSILETSQTQDTTDSTLDFLNDSTNIESSLDFLNDSSTNIESKTQDSTLDSILDSSLDFLNDSTAIESTNLDSTLDFLNDSSTNADSLLANESLENALDSDPKAESNMDLESLGLDSSTQITEDSTFDFLNDSTNIESTLDFLNDSSTNLESTTQDSTPDLLNESTDSNLDSSILETSPTQDSTLDSILDSTLDLNNSNLDSNLDFLNDSSTNADSILANEPLENALNSDPKAESNMDLESLGLDSSTQITEDSTFNAFSDSSSDFFKDLHEISQNNIESKKVSSDFASDSTQELLINDDANPTHILDKDELSSVSDLLKEVNEMPINPPDSKTDSKETSEITESSTPETNEESKPPLSPELEALKDVKHIFPSNIENIGDLNESQLATALGEGDDSFAKLDKALSADDEKALNDAKDSIESSAPQDLNTEFKEPQDELHAELESMEDSLEQKENMESMADLGDDLDAIFDLESSTDSAVQTLESKMESSTDSSLDLNLDSKDLDLSAPQDSNLDSTLDFLNDTKNDKELNLENTLDFSLDLTQDSKDSLDSLQDSSLDFSLDSSLDLTQDSKDSKDTLDFLNDSNFTLDLDEPKEPKEPQKQDSTTEPSLDFDFDNTEHQKLESNLKKSIALDSIFHTDSSISSLDFNFETPLDSNIETEAKNLENIESNDTKNLENLKQMDAKSFINFIKDTPSDKLDKILENADISLNIQFGKKS